MKSKPFYLFMDNLASHRNNTNQKLMRELKITPVYNISQSPDFNPIEACFS